MESFLCSSTPARLGLLCSVSCLARVLGSIREREGPAAFGFVSQYGSFRGGDRQIKLLTFTPLEFYGFLGGEMAEGGVCP